MQELFCSEKIRWEIWKVGLIGVLLPLLWGGTPFGLSLSLRFSDIGVSGNLFCFIILSMHARNTQAFLSFSYTTKIAIIYYIANFMTSFFLQKPNIFAYINTLFITILSHILPTYACRNILLLHHAKQRRTSPPESARMDTTPPAPRRTRTSHARPCFIQSGTLHTSTTPTTSRPNPTHSHPHA